MNDDAPTTQTHLFGREVTLARTLTVSRDPIFDPASRPPAREEVLLALYREVCASWRSLVDVRFKLLALVPAVSAALLSTLLSRKTGDAGLSPAAGVVIGFFGFVVTLALAVYDRRNSQLHDELISRGRRIERELG